MWGFPVDSSVYSRCISHQHIKRSHEKITKVLNLVPKPTEAKSLESLLKQTGKRNKMREMLKRRSEDKNRQRKKGR